MNLLLLPVELLLYIFQGLGDLDDPVCLANACTALRKFFNKHKDSTLWSIIRGSKFHKYDAALCLLHDTMHGEDNQTVLKLPATPFQAPAWMFRDYSKLEFGE
ncbi:hypothetical protein BDV35DRAFT_153450 [Aspergillus flavus]|uniref:F-box domain-containing protein n=1 Tax=Aspergillus flavus TaxID=5059 RepID=A0A5N6GFQ0_ASPFL|nr:hypothetical protein BDV35DRAFT_153450 [Aspergillus flavus]